MGSRRGQEGGRARGRLRPFCSPQIWGPVIFRPASSWQGVGAAQPLAPSPRPSSPSSLWVVVVKLSFAFLEPEVQLVMTHSCSRPFKCGIRNPPPPLSAPAFNNLGFVDSSEHVNSFSAGRSTKASATRVWARLLRRPLHALVTCGGAPTPLPALCMSLGLPAEVKFAAPDSLVTTNCWWGLRSDGQRSLGPQGPALCSLLTLRNRKPPRGGSFCTGIPGAADRRSWARSGQEVGALHPRHEPLPQGRGGSPPCGQTATVQHLLPEEMV